MSDVVPFKIIARIRSPFPGKFGIPRQSGRVVQVVSTIVFEPEYRNADALRGLEGYTHLWVLWHFSESVASEWSPTVRPPRLGGNRRVGVFATRSPNRPNPIGLSCVKISRIYSSEDGPCIEVLGADLMDGTPIFDLKPYLPAADCIPDALGGFSDAAAEYALTVLDPKNLLKGLSESFSQLICGVLAEDPRPAYQKDALRVYSFECAKHRVSFRVEGNTAILESLEKIV